MKRLARACLRQRIHFAVQKAAVFQRRHAHGLLLPGQAR